MRGGVTSWRTGGALVHSIRSGISEGLTPLDERRRRIQEDLKGVFSGELRCDDLSALLYSSDASLFEVRPLGVACPRNREDVETLVRYASEFHIPLIARGAGTNVTGSALGAGLIVDFSRSMTAIEHIGESTVVVQPGVVHERLNRVLRERGCYFPPDPSTSAVTTIGGMIGVDSAGSRAIRVGSTRDYVLRLETIIAGGQVLDFGVERLEFPRSANGLDNSESGVIQAASPAKRTIVSRLAKLLTDHEALIQKHQPPLIRNTSGYFLRGVHGHHELHMPRLLTGSEGTLGLFTSITLHTSPLPEFRGAVLLLFGKMEDAIEAVPAVTAHQVSACDLMDRRLLMLGRENDSRFEHFIPPTAEAGLLIEQIGFGEQQARDRIGMVIRAVKDRVPDVVVALEAYDFDGVEFLWELPRRVVSLLTRMKGETRPLPFTEDIAIPPESLLEFFTRTRRVLQKHDVTSSLYSHAASGQVHMRPFMRIPRQADGPRLQALARDLNAVAHELGGTISGEHGDGLARSCFVAEQYGPLYAVFREVKDIFDPHNLMNPGKIVTEERTLPASKFREEAKPASDLVQVQLNWSPGELVATAESCNGCGGCRSQQEELRMCPFFRAEPSEEAAPRSKANLIRGVVSGAISPATFLTPQYRSLLEQCFNCRQCELECPTHVRIPHLVMEARAQLVEAGELDRATWALSRVHLLGELGCRLAWFSNLLLKNRITRWIIEKAIGLDRRRRIPDFAGRPLLNTLPAEMTGTQPEPRRRAVVYFVDHFANYHDPELGRAFIAILEHHGFRVHVPGGQTGSGMALMTAGDLTAARKVADVNIRELASFAREGLPILCTEPAAALCLAQDYPLLSLNPDTQLVAAQVREAGAFLQQLQQNGELKKDLAPLPVRVGYHTPCHLKALAAGVPLKSLLELIPELEVVPLDHGCSGMAGTFGLTRRHFDQSLAIGRELINRLRDPDVILGATECSSCRIQMEQDSPVSTVHPLKMLAAAYGLMPDLRARFMKLARDRRVAERS